MSALRGGWLHICDMINALIFPLHGVNLRLEDDGCSAPSLCWPAITLTGHCCFCCWCCRLPSDCIHGTGSHRHGDGPREEDPERGGKEGGSRELPVHLQRVQWWWGWIGILFDGRKSCWLEPNQFPIKSCFFFSSSCLEFRSGFHLELVAKFWPCGWRFMVDSWDVRERFCSLII